MPGIRAAISQFSRLSSNDRNQGALLVKSNHRSAQIVRLWHQRLHRCYFDDDGATSHRPPIASVIGFSGRDRGQRGRREPKRLTGRRELLPSREVLYLLHSRHKGAEDNAAIRVAVPACELGSVFGTATITPRLPRGASACTSLAVYGLG
jgi:hypothetical protein